MVRDKTPHVDCGGVWFTSSDGVLKQEGYDKGQWVESGSSPGSKRPAKCSKQSAASPTPKSPKSGKSPKGGKTPKPAPTKKKGVKTGRVAKKPRQSDIDTANILPRSANGRTTRARRPIQRLGVDNVVDAFIMVPVKTATAKKAPTKKTPTEKTDSAKKKVPGTKASSKTTGVTKKSAAKKSTAAKKSVAGTPTKNKVPAKKAKAKESPKPEHAKEPPAQRGIGCTGGGGCG